MDFVFNRSLGRILWYDIVGIYLFWCFLFIKVSFFEFFMFCIGIFVGVCEGIIEIFFCLFFLDEFDFFLDIFIFFWIGILLFVMIICILKLMEIIRDWFLFIELKKNFIEIRYKIVKD